MFSEDLHLSRERTYQDIQFSKKVQGFVYKFLTDLFLGNISQQLKHLELVVTCFVLLIVLKNQNIIGKR